jgi:hypothetical protein
MEKLKPMEWPEQWYKIDVPLDKLRIEFMKPIHIKRPVGVDIRINVDFIVREFLAKRFSTLAKIGAYGYMYFNQNSIGISWSRESFPSLVKRREKWEKKVRSGYYR